MTVYITVKVIFRYAGRTAAIKSGGNFPAKTRANKKLPFFTREFYHHAADHRRVMRNPVYFTLAGDLLPSSFFLSPERDGVLIADAG